MNLHTITTTLQRLIPLTDDIIVRKPIVNQAELAAQFVTTGIFEYYHDGFAVLAQGREIGVRWTEIKSIVAYHSANYRYDMLFLCIICEDSTKNFHINEDTPGWYVFLEEIEQIFASIPPHWHRNFNSATPRILFLKDKLLREHILDNLVVG